MRQGANHVAIILGIILVFSDSCWQENQENHQMADLRQGFLILLDFWMRRLIFIIPSVMSFLMIADVIVGENPDDGTKYFDAYCWTL